MKEKLENLVATCKDILSGKRKLNTHDVFENIWLLRIIADVVVVLTCHMLFKQNAWVIVAILKSIGHHLTAY